MNVDAQDYLELVEATGKLAFFDIESTGLKGDFNSVLVVSIKPYGQDPFSFHISQSGNDKKVVREAGEALEAYHCICGYYSKGFDVPMLNTRRLKWGLDPIAKRHHLDLYFSLKPKLLTTRKSLAHLARWMKLEEQKMDVGPDDWIAAYSNPSGPEMETMIARCESDCAVLEKLYNETKHLIVEIKK